MGNKMVVISRYFIFVLAVRWLLNILFLLVEPFCGFQWFNLILCKIIGFCFCSDIVSEIFLTLSRVNCNTLNCHVHSMP